MGWEQELEQQAAAAFDATVTEVAEDWRVVTDGQINAALLAGLKRRGFAVADTGALHALANNVKALRAGNGPEPVTP